MRPSLKLLRRPAGLRLFHALLLGVLAVVPSLASAADAPDKDKEKKPERPVLLLPLPLALVPGKTNRLVLRGQRVKTTKSLRLTGLTPSPEIQILKSEDAKVPEGSSAAKAGDQQVEIQFFLPAEAPSGTNSAVVAVSPDGESKPLPLVILSASLVVDEVEPNDGFKQAQTLPSSCTVRGLLGEGVDVDVFRISGKAGHTLRAEVIASRLGSTLDSSLTLYSAEGAVLGSNDDSDTGRDALLSYKFTADGPCFLALTSVNEKPSKTHAYLLQVSDAP